MTALVTGRFEYAPVNVNPYVKFNSVFFQQKVHAWGKAKIKRMNLLSRHLLLEKPLSLERRLISYCRVRVRARARVWVGVWVRDLKITIIVILRPN